MALADKCCADCRRMKSRCSTPALIRGVRTIALGFPKTRDGLVVFTNVDAGVSLYAKLV